MGSEQAAMVVGILDAVGIFAGGAFGLVKSKSKPSIVAATICAAMMVGLLFVSTLFFEALWAFLMLVMFAEKALKSGPPPDKMVSLLGEEDAEKVAKTSKKIFAVLAVLSLCRLQSAVRSAFR